MNFNTSNECCLEYRCVCVCVCAVSYTHLDVYKRQLEISKEHPGGLVVLSHLFTDLSKREDLIYS